MHVALVVDLQVVRFEGLGQFGPDGPLDRAAGVGVHVRPEVSQRPGGREAGGGGASSAEDTGEHQGGTPPAAGVTSEPRYIIK